MPENQNTGQAGQHHRGSALLPIGRPTRLLRTCLRVCLGTGIIVAVYVLAQLLTATEQTQWSLFEQGLIAGILSWLFILVAVVLLLWVHRANTNCHLLGAKNMKFTPGWSVGWFFIPLAHLWMPYYAVDEIWRVSKNPQNHLSQPGHALVGWWWVSWLLSFGLVKLNALMLILDAWWGVQWLNPGGNILHTSALLALISGLATVPMCAVFIAFINTVSSEQKALSGQ